MAIIPTGQKFHTVPENVNTAERGSALANSQREIYTMQDIADTARPYKVFTALLTQSGDGSVQSYVENFATVGSTQNLIKGVTYYIDANPDNVDFSSIGAPSKEAGTYFIATENKVNTDFPDVTWALGYNPSAPVVTVLENTIGNIWFEYVDVGAYSIYSNGLFTEYKTVNTLHQTGNISYGNDGIYYCYCNQQNNELLNISVYNESITSANDFLYEKLIEIRVYN